MGSPPIFSVIARDQRPKSPPETFDAGANRRKNPELAIIAMDVSA